MKTMLIAIDSEIITDELAHTFQSKYQVHTCSRGDDALRLLQSIKPDVLIVMLSLPGITGMEVLQQSQHKPSVIIALTTYLSNSIVQEAQVASVRSLIRLPCSIGYIRHNLHTLLTATHRD